MFAWIISLEFGCVRCLSIFPPLSFGYHPFINLQSIVPFVPYLVNLPSFHHGVSKLSSLPTPVTTDDRLTAYDRTDIRQLELEHHPMPAHAMQNVQACSLALVCLRCVLIWLKYMDCVSLAVSRSSFILFMPLTLNSFPISSHVSPSSSFRCIQCPSAFQPQILHVAYILFTNTLPSSSLLLCLFLPHLSPLCAIK